MQRIYKHKVLYTLISIFLSYSTLYATSIDDNGSIVKYDRNGLSVAIITHGDHIDNSVAEAHAVLAINNKFDYNPLHTLYYPSYLKRNLPSEEEYKYAQPVVDIISKYKLPKEVISYCFMRNEMDGTMSTELIQQRGYYNAVDAEYLLANATKVGISALGDDGFNLLANNYILILDYYHTERTDKTWKIKLAAYVFKINYTKETEDAINSAWITDEDTKTEKAQKIAAFNNIKFTASFVTSVKATGSCSVEKATFKTDAIKSAYSNAVAQLEHLIEAWMVKTPVVSVNPIKAKIGSKEGVGRNARFYAYEYVLNSNNKLSAKKRGVVRATETVNNIGYSTGTTTELTEFRQIAGFSDIQEGYSLKQNYDAGMGISLGYQSLDYFEGNLSYLFRMNKNGTVSYGLMNMSGRMYDLGERYDYTAFKFGVGWGYGVHFAHRFELIGFAKYVGEIFSKNDNEEDSDYVVRESFAHKFNIGAKMSMNLLYPLQLYIQADYTTKLASGTIYSNCYEKLTNRGYSSRDGLGFGIGITYNL